MLEFLCFGVPRKFQIKRKYQSHTHYVGTLKTGEQFLGYGSLLPFDYSCPIDDQELKHCSYIHFFDAIGNYLRSDILYTTDQSQVADNLEKLIGSLDINKYETIKVKPFQREFEGVVFGLIPDFKHKTVDLEPSSVLSFKWPWDGTYDT